MAWESRAFGFAFEDDKGENETKLREKLTSTEIHNGQLLARYATAADENEKLRLRIEELEWHEKDMFEEKKAEDRKF